MPKPLDLAGYRHPGSRLVAVRPGRRGHKRVWFCDCDCGTQDVPVETNRLTSGNTRSCGCLQRDIAGINCRALHVYLDRPRCKKCGAFFRRTNPRQLYCDRRCKEDAERFPPEDAECEGCGKPYHRGRSTQRYCSWTCQRRGPLAARRRSCVECGRSFITGKGAPVCCGPECRRRHRRRKDGGTDTLSLRDQFGMMAARLASSAASKPSETN